MLLAAVALRNHCHLVSPKERRSKSNSELSAEIRDSTLEYFLKLTSSTLRNAPLLSYQSVIDYNHAIVKRHVKNLPKSRAGPLCGHPSLTNRYNIREFQVTGDTAFL